MTTYKAYKAYDDSLMDGMIKLFILKGSKKNVWWCRIKVTGVKGYAVGDRSLKTTSLSEAKDLARSISRQKK